MRNNTSQKLLAVRVWFCSKLICSIIFVAKKANECKLSIQSLATSPLEASWSMPESTVIPQHDLMALQGDDSALLAETSVRKDLSAASSPPESLGSPCSSPRAARDSTWLQIEVCRDYRRDTCPRGDDCRFAHPEAKVMGKDSKVTCCYDFLKVRAALDSCCDYFYAGLFAGPM